MIQQVNARFARLNFPKTIAKTIETKTYCLLPSLENFSWRKSVIPMAGHRD